MTDRLQSLLDSVKQSRRCGHRADPRGRLRDQPHRLPARAVRMIGFGQKKKRPRFILRANTPAFRRRRKRTRAKPPTFSGSPATCRASTGRFRTRTPAPLQRRLEHRFLHWAGKPGRRRAARSFCTALLRLPLCFQHRRGQGRHFRCGKRDGKPRVPRRRLRHLHHKVLARLALRLGQSAFCGQRRAAVRSRECGLTFSHVEICDTPAAELAEDGYWEKLFWKDCVLENIAGPALQIAQGRKTAARRSICKTCGAAMSPHCCAAGKAGASCPGAAAHTLCARCCTATTARWGTPKPSG